MLEQSISLKSELAIVLAWFLGRYNPVASHCTSKVMSSEWYYMLRSECVAMLS